MRNETPCLWGIKPAPPSITSGAIHGRIDLLSTGKLHRRGIFAVEVCWISQGTVTCRTYQVRATSEARAARLACQCAGKAMGTRVSRIEAVDVEPLQGGNDHA